jgi:hypothetical protein
VAYCLLCTITTVRIKLRLEIQSTVTGSKIENEVVAGTVHVSPEGLRNGLGISLLCKHNVYTSVLNYLYSI